MRQTNAYEIWTNNLKRKRKCERRNIEGKGSYEISSELNTSGVFAVIVGFIAVCHIIRE
jgi:hypothetical protein